MPTKNVTFLMISPTPTATGHGSFGTDAMSAAVHPEAVPMSVVVIGAGQNLLVNAEAKSFSINQRLSFVLG